MKHHLLISTVVAVAALAFAVPVSAATLSVPSADAAVFTFEAPATWKAKVNKEDESVEATAPENAAYLVSWLVTKGTVSDLTGDIAATLKDSMSKVDSGQKEEKMHVNGVEVSLIKGTGIDKREGSKVSFQVAIFPLPGDKAGILYTDYDTDASADVLAQVKSILNSVKVKS